MIEKLGRLIARSQRSKRRPGRQRGALETEI